MSNFSLKLEKKLLVLHNFLSYKIVQLKPPIVLTSHGIATTSKSLKRDINLSSDVSKLTKKGFEKGKTQDEILLKSKNKTNIKIQFFI